MTIPNQPRFPVSVAVAAAVARADGRGGAQMSRPDAARAFFVNERALSRADLNFLPINGRTLAVKLTMHYCALGLWNVYSNINPPLGECLHR
ncbi:hypothetical protein EVAR_55201_1 [Eumeta japonica]|uniref:Uncharacterized protein n=1 Tax=Eumeta variegata TaxID=151549 RepID=A0A4C1ZCH6_EUMVA|nr:hypothetical protein EVAR_55201_1 [Eumeta japonica]